jgi:hypothetical protein
MHLTLSPGAILLRGYGCVPPSSITTVRGDGETGGADVDTGGSDMERVHAARASAAIKVYEVRRFIRV